MHAVFWWGKRVRHRWEANIQMDHRERHGMKWIDLALNWEGEVELMNFCVPSNFWTGIVKGDSVPWS